MNMHLFKSPSSAISVSIVVLWVPVIEKSLVEENWGGVHEPYQVRNNHLWIGLVPVFSGIWHWSYQTCQNAYIRALL